MYSDDEEHSESDFYYQTKDLIFLLLMKPLEEFSQGIKILLCFQRKFGFPERLRGGAFFKHSAFYYKNG